jgi:hypothetical protein
MIEFLFELEAKIESGKMLKEEGSPLAIRLANDYDQGSKEPLDLEVLLQVLGIPDLSKSCFELLSSLGILVDCLRDLLTKLISGVHWLLSYSGWITGITTNLDGKIDFIFHVYDEFPGDDDVSLAVDLDGVSFHRAYAAVIGDKWSLLDHCVRDVVRVVVDRIGAVFHQVSKREELKAHWDLLRVGITIKTKNKEEGQVSGPPLFLHSTQRLMHSLF